MKSEEKLAFTILNYLSKAPEAKDTLEGITSWWLLKEQIDNSVEKISLALQYLIDNGYIIVHEYPMQSKFYTVNKLKFEEYQKNSSHNLI